MDLSQFTNQRGVQSASLLVQATTIGALMSNLQGMQRQGWNTNFKYGKVEGELTRQTLADREAFRDLVRQRTRSEPNFNAQGNVNSQANVVTE